MSTALKAIGVAAVAAIAILPFLFINNSVSEESCKSVMLVATFVWFAASLIGLKVNASKAAEADSQ